MNDAQRKMAEVVAEVGELVAAEAVKIANQLAADSLPVVERQALAWAIAKHAELVLREKLQETAEGQAYLHAGQRR